jgi:hypothetical protein
MATAIVVGSLWHYPTESVAGPSSPQPARSHAYASPHMFPTTAQSLLPARAGSPFAGQDVHLLDDTQSFMEASHPPILFDQPGLVALEFLSTYSTSHATMFPMIEKQISADLETIAENL